MIAPASKPERVLQVVMGLNRTGIDNMVMNLYRHIDHDLFQFDFAVFSLTEGVHEAEAERLGAQVFHITPRSVDWKASKADLRSLFKHEHYRIVHAHQDCLSDDILKVAAQFGVPNRIAHAHTTQYPTGWRRYYYAFHKRRIASVATDLMACSQAAGRWMFGRQADREGRIFILNNAVDSEAFSFSPGLRLAKRKALGLEDQLVLLNVGRLAPVKNQGFLIEMMPSLLAQHPNAVLLIAGAGELEQKLKSQVEQAGLTGQVRFLGEVPVGDYLQAADVMLMPSLFEGIPLACIEAQITGLPLILSTGISRDVIFTPLVQSIPLEAGPAAWADRVGEAIFSSSVQRRSYVEEAKQGNFDIIGQADRLSEYYRCCLAR